MDQPVVIEVQSPTYNENYSYSFCSMRFSSLSTRANNYYSNPFFRQRKTDAGEKAENNLIKDNHLVNSVILDPHLFTQTLHYVVSLKAKNSSTSPVSFMPLCLFLGQSRIGEFLVDMPNMFQNVGSCAISGGAQVLLAVLGMSACGTGAITRFFYV